jgi:hypothetical protein
MVGFKTPLHKQLLTITIVHHPPSTTSSSPLKQQPDLTQIRAQKHHTVVAMSPKKLDNNILLAN